MHPVHWGACEGLSSTFTVGAPLGISWPNMADESEGFIPLVAEKSNSSACSVPVSVEEVNLEPEPTSRGPDVKCPPGVAPIKAQ